MEQSELSLIFSVKCSSQSEYLVWHKAEDNGDIEDDEEHEQYDVDHVEDGLEVDDKVNLDVKHKAYNRVVGTNPAQPLSG
jgi:hypothetical protein